MQIKRTVVVISNLVDSTVKEYQPDVDFILFHTLNDLGEYIQTTPIRAESLYMTRDVFPESSVNSNLTYLFGMLENPFLGVNRVVYITEKDSTELVSINYILESKNVTNWDIIEGVLNREYVTNVINGTMDQDDWTPKRRAVYRMGKEEYYRSRREEKKSLEDHYESDDELLTGIPDVEPISEPIVDRESSCEVKHFVGIDSFERTALAFLGAQYLSLSGKTVIVEKDYDYHMLTELVTKSEVDCELFLVEDLLRDPNKVLGNIRHCNKSLIVIGSKERIVYSYTFIVNVVINNLMEDITFFVEEDTFDEVPEDIPSNTSGICKSTENIDRNYVDKATFVGVNLNALPEICIKSSETLALILKDVLDIQDIEAAVVSITSLHLRGDTYDMNSIF